MNRQGLWGEFKSFAFKGNIIDLAVAVLIGNAFGAVVTSFVKHIMMPLLGYVLPNKDGYRGWHVGTLLVGEFLGDVVNFLVVAMAIFIMIVKLVGYLMRKAAPPPAPDEPVSKECPFCLMVIPIRASRCGHCTSQLTDAV